MTAHDWQTRTPPGWFPDPWGTPTLRYWDGAQWTDQRVVAATSPFAAKQPRGPFPTLPLAAALAALATTAVALTASRFIVQSLVHYHWPIAVYASIAAVVGYGPLVVVCIVVSRRWGTGNVRDDFGAHFRPVDLGWGPITWISSYIVTIVIAVVIVAAKVPFESNTKGISARSGDRAYIIAFAVLAVACAPIVEELVFRGAVLRGLRSAMPAWLAVGLQGLLFGAAHIDPVRGVKNVGLVFVLAGMGTTFGTACYLIRRLAPTMIAHCLVNTVVLVVVLTR